MLYRSTAPWVALNRYTIKSVQQSPLNVGRGNQDRIVTFSRKLLGPLLRLVASVFRCRILEYAPHATLAIG